MKRPEPQVPDHIVAYLLHKLSGIGSLELDAEELSEALHFRLTMEPIAGNLVLTGHKIHQESPDKKNGDLLR